MNRGGQGSGYLKMSKRKHDKSDKMSILTISVGGLLNLGSGLSGLGPSSLLGPIFYYLFFICFYSQCYFTFSMQFS